MSGITSYLQSLSCGRKFSCGPCIVDIKNEHASLLQCIMCHHFFVVVATLLLTDGITTVATASSVGHIAVWGLDEHRLVTVIRDAHDSAVGGMEFIQSQPLMVTSASDNSVKVIFVVNQSSLTIFV